MIVTAVAALLMLPPTEPPAPSVVAPVLECVTKTGGTMPIVHVPYVKGAVYWLSYPGETWEPLRLRSPSDFVLDRPVIIFEYPAPGWVLDPLPRWRLRPGGC